MRAAIGLAVVAAGLGLCGCATVVKGSTQDVAIDTTPPGASCELTREGVKLGVVDSTPGKFQVSRSSKALTVTCNKQGFAEGTTSAEPKFNGATLGNILLGGVIGVVVDASTGANNSYPEQISVALTPLSENVAVPLTEPAKAMPAAAATPATAATPAAPGTPAAKPAAPAAKPTPKSN